MIYYILLITNGFQLRTPSSSCVSTWRSCAPMRAGALRRWRASSSRPKAAIYLGISWISWGFYWDLTGFYGIWMGFDLGLQKRFYFWFFSWGFYWDFMGDSWDLGFPPHQGYLNGANNDKPRGFAVPYVQTKPYIVGVETKEILVVSRVVTRICYSWFTVHHNGDWLLQWSCMSVCWGLLSSEVFINSVRRIDDGIG